MKIKAGILVFLILFSTILPTQAATNEGYGEDETSLGQFVDSFEDLGNVSVAVNVIRNSTYNAMELNSSDSFLKIYENFTEYTEVDIGADRIQRTDFHIDHLAYRDETTYLYYDKGVDYFTDFEHEFNARSDLAETLVAGGVWGLANDLGDIITLKDANEHFIFVSINRGTSFAQILLREIHNGNFYQDSLNNPVANTWYYFTLNKTGTLLTLEIYSDSDRLNLVDTLSLTMQEDNAFRYIYGCQSQNVGNHKFMNNDIEDLWIGDVIGGFEPAGYFTTVDYLSDPLANGSALVAMINTTIPANTQILVEFSEDNSTWIFNDWQPLFGGFESVDLRDLNFSSGYHTRFNLSTSNSSITPRVYQNRVITTMGNRTIQIQNITGEWVEYRASAINTSVGVVDGGDLNSTFEIDGDTFNVSEVVGAPGMLLSVNFTGIDPDAECVWVTIWYLYDGNLNHVFEIEMWNFTSSSWVTDGLLVDTPVFVWANSTIYALRIPNDFLSGGELRIQLNHETPGNINHDLFIDYIRLIAKVPSDVSAAEELFQFFWIVLAIALTMIILMIAKMWFEKGDP